MQHAGLSGRMGGGLDPCAALQVSIELGEGEFDTLAGTRSLRNELEHGRSLNELQHRAVERAIAVVNRVLVTAALQE